MLEDARSDGASDFPKEFRLSARGGPVPISLGSVLTELEIWNVSEGGLLWVDGGPPLPIANPAEAEAVRAPKGTEFFPAAKNSFPTHA